MVKNGIEEPIAAIAEAFRLQDSSMRSEAADHIQNNLPPPLRVCNNTLALLQALRETNLTYAEAFLNMTDYVLR